MPEFYDQLAEFYHLIYVDWEASVLKQGSQLSSLIKEIWPTSKSVLDVSCGIGTQSIGLAKNGFAVQGSDISPVEIEKARLETQKRRLNIKYSVCDMRRASAHHSGQFDVVISCDNSVAHLLGDRALTDALSSMYECTMPGGGCVISVRDYEQEPRGKNIYKPYGIRIKNGKRYVLFQIWDFEDEIYDLSFFIVEENLETHVVTTRMMSSKCYAVSISRLVELMKQVGFSQVSSRREAYFQPCIYGTRSV